MTQKEVAEAVGESQPTVKAVAREAARAERRPPGWLRDCADRMPAEPRTRFTVARMAAELGVSPARLSRDFRRHYGTSIGDYVRRAWVDYVSHRLRGGADLAALALEAGFADQSHLNRVFERFSGSTPGAARRPG